MEQEPAGHPWTSIRLGIGVGWLGLSLIISTIIVANTLSRIKAAGNTLTVTGSVREQVTSDVVKWTAAFSRTTVNRDVKQANTLLEGDLRAVREFLKARGVREGDFTLSPVTLQSQVRWEGGKAVEELSLRRTVHIESGDVGRITQLAGEANDLMQQGVLFATERLEYYYSGLSDLRVRLMSGAIEDARTRAQTIAESSRAKLGKIRSVSAGVVQVLQPQSTEVSGAGAYDTSTIEKEVMATAHATFALR
jgi:hypothetical protein